MTPQDVFLQQLINGLSIGMVYCLIALGYTIVYGIIQLINFAHGEVFMVGAYLGLSVCLGVGMFDTTGWASFGLIALMFAVAMAGCGAMGIVIEKTAYRPLRRSGRLAPLISAIGVSFFLQNAMMLVWGARDLRFPPVVGHHPFHIAGATVTLMQLLIITTSLVLMVGLHLFVNRTRLGRAMRATAQDIAAAQLMGIPTDRIISISFMVGSALAAGGGILFGMYYGTINFHDGYLVGLKAFTAAVLGGIGNIPGAMLGGMLIGLAESFGAGYLSSEWKNAFAFVILVLILIFRPSGLLGERVSERA